MKILNIIGLAILAGLLYAVPAQAKLVCVQVTPVYLSCSNDRDITVEGRIDAGSGVTVTDPDVPGDPPGDPGNGGKDKDNKGHGNGDEGDAKGKDGHDNDNPGNGGGGKGGGKGNGKNK